MCVRACACGSLSVSPSLCIAHHMIHRTPFIWHRCRGRRTGCVQPSEHFTHNDPLVLKPIQREQCAGTLLTELSLGRLYLQLPCCFRRTKPWLISTVAEAYEHCRKQQTYVMVCEIGLEEAVSPSRGVGKSPEVCNICSSIIACVADERHNNNLMLPPPCFTLVMTIVLYFSQK